MAHSRVTQWATMTRTWWIYDANYQCPFKTAYRLLPYLQGLNKPVYHNDSDVGDHVVVFNTKHIAMRGDFWRTFKHFHHTKFAGGFSRASAWRVHEMDPTRILERAVYSCLAGVETRKMMMKRLHLYPEEDVPEKILENVTGQIRQVQIVPKKLTDYSQEEIDKFPKLFEYPEDYDVEGYKRENRQEPDQHTSMKWRLK
ncbi:39S ribosomal protein L13 mitochondrial [Biomphalaria pfeifferi]|uniref:Large ribosomal subunit protein uL13m n=1 Tax=Biomphalaria pfeifferi TaxID=112525 RepID=A0AAD8FPK4_BIOPF|nr:39S ribosomal protein L13 mitochondrial [Biomphalaria pfeifferi]